MSNSRMDQEWIKLFKDCLPQILLGSFLNTLSHITNGPYSEKTRSSVTAKNEKATKKLPEYIKTVIAYKNTNLSCKFPVIQGIR